MTNLLVIMNLLNLHPAILLTNSHAHPDTLSAT